MVTFCLVIGDVDGFIDQLNSNLRVHLINSIHGRDFISWSTHSRRVFVVINSLTFSLPQNGAINFIVCCYKVQLLQLDKELKELPLFYRKID